MPAITIPVTARTSAGILKIPLHISPIKFVTADIQVDKPYMPTQPGQSFTADGIDKLFPTMLRGTVSEIVVLTDGQGWPRIVQQ